MELQTWVFRNFTASEGPQAAVDFLNEPARQGPGEACAVARTDGSVGVFFLEPGSQGSSTALTWDFWNFTAAHKTQTAVTFLNAALRQGPGEASANTRNDGSVGLLYLEPGTLGSGIAPTWVFLNFSAAHGPQGAVNYLNAPARQGAGQVSAVARTDGSVGVLFLVPGALGSIAAPTWRFKNFTADEGTEAAVDFLNEAPRQGPGEASANARYDGSVGLFYLARGTG